VSPLEVAADRVHFRLRLRGRNPTLQSRQHRRSAIAARGHVACRDRHHERYPQVGGIFDAAETARHHSHDGVNPAIQLHHAAEHARVSAEAALP
jgi:hypothetical protein